MSTNANKTGFNLFLPAERFLRPTISPQPSAHRVTIVTIVNIVTNVTNDTKNHIHLLYSMVRTCCLLLVCLPFTFAHPRKFQRSVRLIVWQGSLLAYLFSNPLPLMSSTRRWRSNSPSADSEKPFPKSWFILKYGRFCHCH